MVRFKNRYIAVEITPQGNNDKTLILKPTALRYSIQKKVEKMYGDFGLAAIKASFNAKYCNTHTGIALIKCRHGPHNFLIDSIPMINDVGGRFVSTQIIYVGATMKHCFFFIQEHQQRKLQDMWGEFKSYTVRTNMIETCMTLPLEMKEFK